MTDKPSNIDLIVDGLVGLIPTGLVAVGASSSAVAVVVAPLLTPFAAWAKVKIRDHLAEQLPTLRIPDAVSLESELQDELDRLRPATIPAPPPSGALDASDPANSLLTGKS